MLTRSELPENPVVLNVAGAAGERHRVTTERLRGGKIRMICTCDASAAEGWCRHQVELLCMRYDSVIERDETAEFHFEDIVMGTPLADTADEVELALDEFDQALTALMKRPPGTDPADLRTMAGLADAVAEASRQLDRALERLRKRLAGGLG
jgi:uncharacterized Zn finger protein